LSEEEEKVEEKNPTPEEIEEKVFIEEER